MGKNPCPPCEEGLPAWMGTFADMMTLLMCFFVLLFAMSTLDPVKMQQMQQSAQKKLGIQNESSPQMIKNELEIQTELKEIVEELDIDDKAKVSRDPRGIAVEFDGSICFASGTTNLTPELKRILNILVDRLNVGNDLRPILVEGHSDNVAPSGSIAKKYPTNWELSSARASVVVNKIIDKSIEFSQQGINEKEYKDGRISGRLSAAGYADQWPADLSYNDRREGSINQQTINEYNSSEELKSKNRRIKIIYKKQ